MKPSWIQSYSGLKVTPLELRPEQVRFEDIPHALAQKVRFNGHLRELGYSVAQHCVLGAEEILRGPPSDISFGFAFLLHEVDEVYLPDVPSPIKHALVVKDDSISSEYASPYLRWDDLCARHADVVFKALELEFLRPLIDTEAIHTTDRRMLLTEKRDLMDAWPKEHAAKALETWGPQAAGYEPFDFKITRCWAPAEAEERFTALYERLRFGQRP